ncbi:MAG: TetR/AcrR family transcriptional regulator [Sphingobacteriales bacterium]|nr:TetR/AcrR family transcriptional regulator [Sphingobacteriales bacterium]
MPDLIIIMDVRERIRGKAHDLFMQYGIRSVSMDDIAAQLGMSKKTIYQFFADKDELVEAVVNDELDTTQKDCMQCLTAAKDAIEEMLLTMEQVHEQMSNMNPMVLFDLEKFHQQSFQKFLKHKNEFLYKVIKANMERGIKEELYRPGLNIDVMTKYRLESMMVPFNVFAFPPGKYNLADVTHQVMEHFLFGLTTLKGHKQILKYKQERIKTES